MIIRPMPRPAAGADHPQNSQRRNLYLALLLSLTLHATLLQLLPQSHPTPVHSTRLSLSLSLRSTATAKQKPLQQETLSPHAIDGSQPEITGNQRQAGPIARSGKPPEPVPDLSPENIRGNLEPIAEYDSAAESLSENGAVVMHPTLLARLNEAERRTGLVDKDLLPDMDSSFSGGAWTDLVRFGDKCFLIRRADPLDSTSREMWFRAACPR